MSYAINELFRRVQGTMSGSHPFAEQAKARATGIASSAPSFKDDYYD
jgi:hypothetical protein